MRRFAPIMIAGFALIAVACRDSISPPAEAVSPSSLVRLGNQSYSRLVKGSDDANAVTSTFDIPAAGGRVRVGEFRLRFDHHAVCDPQTAGYGPEFWRKPCRTLDRDFRVTARIFTSDGESHVEFQPDIRFHPDKDVTIAVTRTEIVGQRLTRLMMMEYGLRYTRQIGNTRYYIDEAWGDPELVTRFDTGSGRVWRRIRHFSGQVIRTGYCTENPYDPSCAGGEMQ